MIRRFVAFATLGLMLGGCNMVDAVKEGMAQSEAVATTIEKQVGVKPQVGFSYHNGSFTAATVQFSSLPSANLSDVEKISRKAVVTSFKSEPESLVVSFMFKKNGAAN